MYLIKWKHKFFKCKNPSPIFTERKDLAQRFETYKDAEEITKTMDVKMKIMEEKK